ncbi:MAG: hypothetical protein Q8L14_21895 [Myxococcales bacterium]|nr:hypothetical protein [Myxococcales bacterium]
MARRKKTPHDDSIADRCSFILAPGTRLELTHQGLVPISTALREAIHDRLNFFALPAPAREVLDADMKRRGIRSQRDYVIWLLMERHRHVLGAGGDVGEAA